MKYDTTPGIINSSDLRTEITGLTHPRKGKIYLVMKHGSPVFLIWPTESMTSIFEQKRKMLMAIKARNAIHELPIIEEVPAAAPRATMTTMRRRVTDFLRTIALSPIPGFITNYDIIVGIYVPINAYHQAVEWIEALNRQVD
jgi:hypothetical protein